MGSDGEQNGPKKCTKVTQDVLKMWRARGWLRDGPEGAKDRPSDSHEVAKQRPKRAPNWLSESTGCLGQPKKKGLNRDA